MTRTTITEQGYVAIPKPIRDSLHLEPGTQVEIDVSGSTVVLTRIDSPDSGWRAMRGMIETGPNLTSELEREHLSELTLDDEAAMRP